MTESSSARPLWRRPLTWVLLVVGLVAVWLIVSLALTGWHAKQANTALANMKAQIAAGEVNVTQQTVQGLR